MSKEKAITDIHAIDLNNTELQKALQIIQFTNNSLFLTGKAGTGNLRFFVILLLQQRRNILFWPQRA